MGGELRAARIVRRDRAHGTDSGSITEIGVGEDLVLERRVEESLHDEVASGSPGEGRAPCTAAASGLRQREALCIGLLVGLRPLECVHVPSDVDVAIEPSVPAARKRSRAIERRSACAVPVRVTQPIGNTAAGRVTMVA